MRQKPDAIIARRQMPLLNKIAPVGFPKKLTLGFHVRENQNFFARPASVEVPQDAGGILPVHRHRRPFGQQANDILDGRDVVGRRA